MRKIHCLKITPPHFDAVCDGIKKSELRFNDRDFECGDYILLTKYISEFTSDVILVEITHILPVMEFIKSASGWVVLSISTAPNEYAVEILAAKLRELS